MSDHSNDSTAPELTLDFGVGMIHVKGDENTGFDEVVDEFNEQKEDMIDQIRDLKEFERELQEEYGPELEQMAEDPLDTGRGVN
jgi:hypothetical protein